MTLRNLVTKQLPISKQLRNTVHNNRKEKYYINVFFQGVLIEIKRRVDLI